MRRLLVGQSNPEMIMMTWVNCCLLAGTCYHIQLAKCSNFEELRGAVGTICLAVAAVQKWVTFYCGKGEICS